MATDDAPDGIDVDALLTWVNQHDWENSQNFLDTHPALLDPRAVAELHRQTAVQPKATQVLMLDDHAWLLRLCLQHGVADGYADYHRIVETARERVPEADDAELRHTLTGDPAALTPHCRSAGTSTG